MRSGYWCISTRDVFNYFAFAPYNKYADETISINQEDSLLFKNLQEDLGEDFSNVLDVDTDQTYIYYASFTNPDLYNLKLKASQDSCVFRSLKVSTPAVSIQF